MPQLLQPGDECGGRRIVRLLGEGGEAQVYEAIERTGERRALKVIGAAEGLSAKIHGRFSQEGEAIALIVHPNVVRIYDAGTSGDRVWLALELVDGVPLSEKLRRGAALPPLEDLLFWLQGACDGVAEAHRVGIVHRDLKPENIIITTSGIAKVIDFGVAKIRDWGVKTTSLQQLGTALYSGPDQLRGEPANPRMDVYAMGVVLYETIAGVHPAGRGPWNMPQVVKWQFEGTPQPLRQIAPEISPRLEYAVHHAMEKDPIRRIQTMQELVNELREESTKLQATQRRAARNIPVPDRESVLQPTVPTPGADTASPALSSTLVSPRGASAGAGAKGTIPMAAYSGTTPASSGPVAKPHTPPAGLAATAPLPREGERLAMLPAAGQPSASSKTLVSAAAGSAIEPACDGDSGPVAIPISRVESKDTGARLPVASTPTERRSTGVPVESSVGRSTSRRRGRAWLALAAVGLGLAAGATWWSLRQQTEPAPAATRPAPPPASVSAPTPPPAPTPSTTVTQIPTATTAPSAVAPPRRPSGQAPSRAPRPASPTPAPTARNRLFGTDR